MALPSNVSTGTVTGQFVVAVADGSDSDYDPDTYPVGGTVTFTPSVPYLPDPSGGVTILAAAITGIFDGDGYLCTPDPDNTKVAGRRGVQLIATDDPDLSVTGWTWKVSYSFLPLNKVALPQVPPHDILVPSGGTVDLTSAVKVPSSSGVGLDQVTIIRSEALQAASDADASADLAGSRATDAAGFAAASAGSAAAAAGAAADAVEAGLGPVRLELGALPTRYAPVTASGAQPVGRGEINYNQLERAYRKRITHSLPFKGAGYAAAKALWGDYYPQTFAVDKTTDEMFIISVTTPTTKNVVTVYSWSTGAYKSIFAFDASAITEGAVLKREPDGKRYLYARTGTSTLSKFDVTTTPAHLSVVTPVATYPNTASGVNFTYRNGFWTVSDSTPPIGNAAESRGYFKRMDDSFTTVGQMSFPESYSGGNSAGYRDNSLPKMQGFTEADGYFAVSIGGYYAAGDAVTPYSYQGIRLVSPQGEIMLDALLRPDLMIGLLQSKGGLSPTRIEAEGVICLDGALFSLNVTSTYSAATGPTGSDNQGILIMEEMSDHPGAIDFSPAAVSWTQTPVHRIQTGLQPRSDDGKMHNAVTHEVLDTIPKILAYMALVNQSVFRFYSSSVTVLDNSGIAYPAGNLVTIYNSNNVTYFVRVDGANASTWKLVSDGAGAYIQTLVAVPAHTHALTDMTGRITAAQGPAMVTLGAGVDLNNQTSDGRFNQPSNTDATLALNYPVPYLGKLTVDVSGSNIYQTYQTYSAQNRFFYRSKYSTNPWGAWVEMQTVTGRAAYAVAAGTVSVPVIAAGATTTVTITYPASRFSVAPVLNLVSGDGRVTVGVITANSATSATVTLCNYTAASSAAATGNWQAKQMTSTTAAG